MNLISTKREKLFAVVIAIILHILIILLFLFYKMVENREHTLDLMYERMPALNSIPAQVSFALPQAMPQVVPSKVVQPDEDHSQQQEDLDLNKQIVEQIELSEDYSAGKYKQEAIEPEAMPLTNNPLSRATGLSDNMSNEQSVLDILNIKDEKQDLSANIAQAVQDFAISQLEEIDKKATSYAKSMANKRRESKQKERKFTGKDLLKAFCTQVVLVEQSDAQEQQASSSGVYGVTPKNGSLGGNGGKYVPGYIQERVQEFKAKSYSTRLTKALENAFRLYSKERYFDHDIMTSVDITMIIGRDGKISKVVFKKSTGNNSLDEDIKNVILQCEHLPIPKHLNVKEFVYHMPCYVTLHKGYGKINFTDENRKY